MMVALFNSGDAQRARAQGAFRRCRRLARQRRRDLADAGDRAGLCARGQDRRGRRSRPHGGSRLRPSRQPHQRQRRHRQSEPGVARTRAHLWFEWMVEDLERLIRRGMNETPPLDHSYFSKFVSRKSGAVPMYSVEKIRRTQEALRGKGVKYCIGAYVDIHGVPKGKVVPIDHLEHMAARFGTLHRLCARRSRPGAARRRDHVGARSRSHHPAAVGAEGRVDAGRQHVPGQALRAEHARRAEERAGSRRPRWASASISASNARSIC